MKSLQNVIDAILAHLRSWPVFYADPDSGPGGPAIPPASAAAALGLRPPADRAPDVRAPGGRTPESRNPIGRSCYRVAPTEWGAEFPGPAGRSTGETASRRGRDQQARQATARRRGSSPLGANVLPSPRGLLTCAPGSSEGPGPARRGLSLK